MRSGRKHKAARLTGAEWFPGEGDPLDPVSGSPYVRRFHNEVFRLPWQPLDEAGIWKELQRARLVLLAEYHPLPSAAESALELLHRWRAEGHACGLALEMVHARDQHLLDAFLRGRLGEDEFRRRMRYKEEWGYPWSGPAALLRFVREQKIPVRGIDIAPRGGAEDLTFRDRVAAERIGAWLEETGPKFRLAVLYGEAHAAKQHLTRRLAPLVGARNLIRVFHDLGIPWGGPASRVFTGGDGVFNFERRGAWAREPALRRTWQRWQQEAPAEQGVDLPLLIHDLAGMAALALELDLRRTRSRAGWRLADRLPEVFSLAQTKTITRALQLAGVGVQGRRDFLARAGREGGGFHRRSNLIVLTDYGFDPAARFAAAWLAAGLRGALGTGAGEPAAESAAFVETVLIEILIRLIDPRLRSAAVDRIQARAAALARPIALRLVAESRARAQVVRWLRRPLQNARNTAQLMAEISRFK